MIKRFGWRIAAVWTVVIVLGTGWHLFDIYKKTLELAIIQAAGSFEKDVAYRRWAANHGGVYVPPTDETPPNPYLSHIRNRDVTTLSGLELTLVNPAYMTRQVHDLGRAQYGHQGHITSLNPLRPENAPDAWEAEALRTIENGNTEVAELMKIEDTDYLRLMRPLITEARCLECHAQQGYKEGDLRGGISVSVPMAPLWTLMNHQMTAVAVGYTFIWLLGLGGIGFSAWHMRRQIRERDSTETSLKESEEKFSQMFETMNNGVAVYEAVDDGQNFILTDFNTAAERIEGLKKEAVIGQRVTTVFPGVEELGLLDVFKRVWRTGEAADHPVRLYTDDRLTGWRENFVYKLQSGAIVAIYDDITERKQTEEELKKSEEKYRLLTDTITDNIWILDLDTLKFTYSNPSIVSITGYSAKEVMGLGLQDVLTPSSMTLAARLLSEELSVDRRNTAPSTSATMEFEQYHKDGSTVWTEVSVRFLSDKQGRRTSILGVTRDIRERKRLQNQLQKAQKMESMGLLAGGVAHDLNNVLSGIVSYPELLLMDLPEDSELRKPIETIRASGHRAAAIVQDLLTVARGVATAKEPLNLNDLISGYLNSPEFNKLKQFHPAVTIKPTLDSDLFNINGSHIHIRKVVMNLVSNASEAIEGNGNVAISTTNRYIDSPLRGYEDVTIGEYAVLAVSDDGPGISPDDLKKIFEPFYTKKIMGRSGTGLGLTVVWNVLQDHNGNIDVTTGGDGTTFELYFPITRDDILDKNLSIPVQGYKGNKETILVVDDVESQREISCKILDRLGYKTKAVSSGEAAVDYLKKNRMDLVLLDMIMAPGINGRETYRRIIKIHPDQKAVIVSGFAETDEVKETQKLGAGRYIKKPVTLEKLGLAVKAELEK
jgi:PAS domain S-box-containing protein